MKKAHFGMAYSKTIFPYFSQKKGVRLQFARVLEKIGFGSTLNVIALKESVEKRR